MAETGVTVNAVLFGPTRSEIMGNFAASEAEREGISQEEAERRFVKQMRPAGASSYVRPIRADDQRNLTRSIAQGRVWLQQMLSGRTIRFIAEREGRSERAVRMTLSLAFLDPKLVSAALHSTLPHGASARRLTDAPMLWHQQWQAIGLSRPA